MALRARARSQSSRRTVAYAVGAAVLVLVVVAGLAFANSARVTRVTDNARSLHWTNATIGTSALTRAGLIQAVTFAELAGNGVVEQSDFEFAMDQVSASASELEHLYEIGLGHDSYALLGLFVSEVSTAMGELESGDTAAAKDHISTEVEDAYIDLSDSLQIEQESIQTAIDENSADGRAVNSWIVFFLTLAVPGSAVIVYSIVARRQMRALRERNRLELEAERRISKAKDSFIAGLSHELRTPLTSIYGFAEILSEGDVRGAEMTQETAHIIANEAAEMTRMVDDLLAASRLESTGVEIEMSRTNVRDVVDGAIAPFVRAGLEIEWEPTTALVETDAARLRHVLVNLVSNAARHGGSNRGIAVTEGEDEVDIEVWDDGPGVPEDKVGRLFDRFVHDDDAPLLTGSVGLGLAVASRLTALMGGRLRYQRSGAKTYFVVTLSTIENEIAPAEDHDESVASTTEALSE